MAHAVDTTALFVDAIPFVGPMQLVWLVIVARMSPNLIVSTISAQSALSFKVKKGRIRKNQVVQ